MSLELENAHAAGFTEAWHEAQAELTRRDELIAELVAAGQIVLAGLNARIDAAPSSAKPVFNGIADLHDAIRHATRGGRE